LEILLEYELLKLKIYCLEESTNVFAEEKDKFQNYLINGKSFLLFWVEKKVFFCKNSHLKFISKELSKSL
jgi:hypothetical protein